MTLHNWWFPYCFGTFKMMDFFIIVVVIRKVSQGKDTSHGLHLERTTTCSVCVGADCSCAMGRRSVCPCNTTGMQESFRDAVSEPETQTPWSRSAQVRSETFQQVTRMGHVYYSFPFSYKLWRTLNKQGCIFCSVVSRNTALHSFSHGTHFSGELLFCTIRTFWNQKFWIKESVWELKLNLASGLMNRIFTFRF